MYMQLLILLACDEACGCGYQYVNSNLDGVDKSFSQPGQGIENCRGECDSRAGCTSFEYNHAGNENYKCATYIDGDKNLRSNGQSNKWTSCIKIQQGNRVLFGFVAPYVNKY